MVFCLVGIANAASPDFQNTVPRGGQIGKEVKVTFSGTRLIDAVDVISHYPGITAKDLKVIDTKKVEVTLVVTVVLESTICGCAAKAASAMREISGFPSFLMWPKSSRMMTSKSLRRLI